MAEVMISHIKELASPELRAHAQKIADAIIAAGCKAAAHHGDPAKYPLPEGESLEKGFLGYLRGRSTERQKMVVDRCLPLVRDRKLRGFAGLDVAGANHVLGVALAGAKLAPLTKTTDLVTKAAPVMIEGKPGFRLQAAIDRLQFRLTRVTCVDETDGLLGSEAGSDEIAVGGLIVDAAGAQVQIPQVYVGAGFEDNVTRAVDRLLGEVDFRSGTGWPKTFQLVLVLVEIDNGGFPAFLDMLLREVGKQIAEALIDVGSSLAGPIGAAIGAVIGFIVNLVFGWIKDIWEDDYFPPCPVSFTFNSADDRWAGRTETDPLPIHWWGHGGEYLVWFQARLELAPVARPVGRYNIDTGASGEWHGVLTLAAEGQPAFINYGYAHEDYSREQLGNVQWNDVTKTLSFTRTLYSNVVNQAYVLTFQADGSFSGTCGGGPAKGGPRGQSDAVPLPVAVYDIIANKVFRGVLRISGSDPAALTGTLNLGGGDEALRDVRWDAQNQTLTFLRPSSNQVYGLTFIDQGKVFHGGFGDPSNKWYSANGTRR